MNKHFLELITNHCGVSGNPLYNEMHSHFKYRLYHTSYMVVVNVMLPCIHIYICMANVKIPGLSQCNVSFKDMFCLPVCRSLLSLYLWRKMVSN